MYGNRSGHDDGNPYRCLSCHSSLSLRMTGLIAKCLFPRRTFVDCICHSLLKTPARRRFLPPFVEMYLFTSQTLSFPPARYSSFPQVVSVSHVAWKCCISISAYLLPIHQGIEVLERGRVVIGSPAIGMDQDMAMQVQQCDEPFAFAGACGAAQ